MFSWIQPTLHPHLSSFKRQPSLNAPTVLTCFHTCSHAFTHTNTRPFKWNSGRFPLTSFVLNEIFTNPHHTNEKHFSQFFSPSNGLCILYMLLMFILYGGGPIANYVPYTVLFGMVETAIRKWDECKAHNRHQYVIMKPMWGKEPLLSERYKTHYVFCHSWIIAKQANSHRTWNRHNRQHLKIMWKNIGWWMVWCWLVAVSDARCRCTTVFRCVLMRFCCWIVGLLDMDVVCSLLRAIAKGRRDVAHRSLPWPLHIITFASSLSATSIGRSHS